MSGPVPSLLSAARATWRLVRHSPGFAAAAIVSLALGIGANTALFSVTAGILLRPLPYAEPDRLVILWNRSPGLGITEDWFSTAQYFDIRNGQQAFSDVAIAIGAYATLTGRGEPERVGTLRVSSNLLPMLGARPAAGRLFVPEDDTPGRAGSAVLSHGAGTRRFGADPAVIGRALVLNGEPYEIVGVLPAGFTLPREVLPTLGVVEDGDVYLPLPLAPAAADVRTAEDYNLLARLKPGVTVAMAQAELDALTARLRRDHPAIYPPNGGLTFSAVPLLDQVVGDVRRPLVVLTGAVLLVLLIACANVANLQLSRALARRRELAMRAALGASRGRLAGELLGESILLACLGGVAGVGLAWGGVQWLRALRPITCRGSTPSRSTGRCSPSRSVSVVTGALFGRRRSSARPTRCRRGAQDRRARRLRRRSAVGAWPLAAPRARRGRARPGRDAGDRRRADDSQRRRPARRAAGFRPHRRADRRGGDDRPPLSGWSLSGPAVPRAVAEARGAARGRRGRRRDGAAAQRLRRLGPITPEGIEPPASASSTPTSALRPAATSRRWAFRWSADVSSASTTPPRPSGSSSWTRPRALLAGRGRGRQAPQLRRSDEDTPWERIVGVVGRVQQYGLDTDDRIAIYRPHAQRPARALYMAVRADADPESLRAAALDAVRELDPDLPLHRVTPMPARVDRAMAGHRFAMTALVLFAGVAVALAVVGTYGVLAYLVRQGTRDLGVRLAIGAAPASILAVVIRQGLALAVAGLAVGVAGALLMGRVLEGLLYGVSPRDPVTLAATTLVLLAAAGVACWLPARRAAAIAPAISLRAE